MNIFEVDNSETISHSPSSVEKLSSMKLGGPLIQSSVYYSLLQKTVIETSKNRSPSVRLDSLVSSFSEKVTGMIFGN